MNFEEADGRGINLVMKIPWNRDRHSLASNSNETATFKFIQLCHSVQTSKCLSKVTYDKKESPKY